MRTRTASIALVLALAASGCSDDDDGRPVAADATTTTTRPASEFVEGTCAPPIPKADGFRCGTVTVPVQRGDDDSPTIDIAVAILPAPTPGLHDDPIVVVDRLEPALVGYDGVSALPQRTGRDVVIFDIRGMGRSGPSLECSEIDYLVRYMDTDPDVRGGYLDLLDQCRARLESEGVDLTAYTIGAIADDVIDIRRALGYDSWNVVGYGQYGTDPGGTSADIVFELMRRDGDAIRSVTLESPTPPQQDPWSVQVENLDRALEAMVAACAEQPACAAAHPDLRDRVTASLQQPRTEHPATSAEGDAMTVVFDPAWMGFYLASAVGSPNLFPLLPSLLGMPTPADLAPVVAANTGEEAPDNARIHGVWLSALCSQTGADSTPEDRTGPTSLGVVSWSVYVERDSCARWEHADADPALDEPVTSDIPTLLLVGRFDPSSSLAGARLVASTLPNAYVHEVPDATSNPLGSSECARELRNAFVDDPTREPDTSCLASAAPPAFVG